MDCLRSEPKYSLRETNVARANSANSFPLLAVTELKHPRINVFSCSPVETRFQCVPMFGAHQEKQAFLKKVRSIIEEK